jgi:hypothetical protein
VLTVAATMTCTYQTVGSDTFTMPAGVGSVQITVTGAQGGHYFIAGDPAHGGSPLGDITGRPGGAAGQAAGTLRGLKHGQVLQIDVAGRGTDGTAISRSGGMSNGPSGGLGASGGFGGSNDGVPGFPGDASGGFGGTAQGNGGNGSGGGGSSDVRVAAHGCAALQCGLPDRVLVGAGGGGGGGTGGQGGALGGAGGAGGGIAGSDGGALVDGGNAGVSGQGGTQAAGGAGGLNPCRHGAGNPPSGSPLTDPRCGGDGINGVAGPGGTGGAGNLPCTGTQNPPCRTSATTSGGGAGGGAGGGYLGGGGGSGGGGIFGGGGGAGGGGAGGSSFAAPSIINPILSAGASPGTINNGNGKVTITWTPTRHHHPRAPATVTSADLLTTPAPWPAPRNELAPGDSTPSRREPETAA